MTTAPNPIRVDTDFLNGPVEETYFIYATPEEASAPEARFNTDPDIDEAYALHETFSHGALLVFKDGDVRYVHTDKMENVTTLMDGNTWSRTLYYELDFRRFLRKMENGRTDPSS